MRNTKYINFLAAVGNTNLIAASQIPTAAEAARRYYNFQKSNGYKSLKDVKSLIGGRPLTRRSGVQPKVGAFGDHFGATPMHRVETDELNQWFVLRVPPERSPAFRKKVKSFLSGFLHYCHSQGWISAALLVAADGMD